MRYKGKEDLRSRELMRLFELEVYDGDPDDPKTKTTKETIVAWNAMDAIRRCGARRLATQPKELHHVTHPDQEGEPIYKIKDTGGPTEEEVKPSIDIDPAPKPRAKPKSKSKSKSKDD